MSTSFTEIPVPLAGQPSRLRRLVSLLRSRGTWVLTDQAIVSLGNFLTATLLGRHLPQAAYGAFGLLLENMLFLNSLQAALVIYPYSVRVAANPARLGRLSSASVLFTLVLLPLLGGGMIGVAWAAGVLDLSGWALAAILMWQLQETFRRGLMADMRFADTVWGDAISYIGQAAMIFALAVTHRLTLGNALIAITLTSCAAALLQAWQIRPKKIPLAEIKETTGEFWRLGRWTLLTSLLTVIGGSSYLWVLSFTHGLESVAVFMAILAMMKLTHPIMSSATSLIVPATARARARGGISAAKRVLLRYSSLGLLLVPIYAFFMLAPALSIKIVYGWDTPYAASAPLLRIYVISYTLVFINAVAAAALTGLERPQHAFAAQLANAILTLLIGLPLTAWLGVLGMIVGGQISVIGVLAVHLYWLRHAFRQPQTDAPPTRNPP